jgi:biopolymer transport protein ExbD
MSPAPFSLGALDSTELIPRQPYKEPPEFDITAMVDLVFMMNIYFLVTFVTVSLTQVDLPAATHVAALDADTSVIFTVEGGGDTDKPFVVYVGDRETGVPIRGAEQQEASVKAAVEEGLAAGKTEVLLKAEKYVRLGDLFRISTAASSVEGVKLNVAVMEKEQP